MNPHFNIRNCLCLSADAKFNRCIGESVASHWQNKNYKNNKLRIIDKNLEKIIGRYLSIMDSPYCVVMVLYIVMVYICMLMILL